MKLSWLLCGPCREFPSCLYFLHLFFFCVCSFIKPNASSSSSWKVSSLKSALIHGARLPSVMNRSIALISYLWDGWRESWTLKSVVYNLFCSILCIENISEIDAKWIETVMEFLNGHFILSSKEFSRIFTNKIDKKE